MPQLGLSRMKPQQFDHDKDGQMMPPQQQSTKNITSVVFIVD
jgi:hypothetical protein